MSREPWIRALWRVTIAAGAVMILTAVAVPHVHVDADTDALTDLNDACRACQISDGLTATTMTLEPVTVQPVLVRLHDAEQPALVHSSFVPPSACPRAPPLFA